MKRSESYEGALQRQGEKKRRRKALIKVADRVLPVVYGVLKNDQDYSSDYVAQQRQRPAA